MSTRSHRKTEQRGRKANNIKIEHKYLVAELLAIEFSKQKFHHRLTGTIISQMIISAFFGVIISQENSMEMGVFMTSTTETKNITD